MTTASPVNTENRSLFPSAELESAKQPDFEELLALSRRRFPEDRYRHIGPVVVFAEHATQLRDGRPVVYTPEVLERIAANCNRRILRGNWAAVSIGHIDPTKDSPPLIGCAGPFRVQQQDGRAVITAEFWILNEEVPNLLRYPRPSPEVWIPTDSFDPDRIYLDPIALLGAETPRLDMGMIFLYTKQADGGWQCEKYAAPSPSSVAVPDTSFRKTSYEKGTNMLSSEDIQVILKAIESTDWYQWIRRQMAENQKASAEESTEAQKKPPEQDQAEAQKETYTQSEQSEEKKPKQEEEKPKESESYCRPECKSGYRREEDVAMEKELYQLRQALEQERALRINTERRRRLEQLARFYVVDVSEEMELCKYGRMDDPAFEKHLERIEKYYRPLPVDAQLPAWTEADPQAGSPASRELYQRKQQEALSERAAALARRLANRGQWISYEEALERVRSGKDGSLHD